MYVEVTEYPPLENTIFWQVHGTVGVVDYMPQMNDSISQAMVNPDTRYDALMNIGWAVPLPNRPFRYITQAIVGAPPNFRLVVCAVQNPITRAVIALTLGRETALKRRFLVVGTVAVAVEIIRRDRNL